MGYIVSVWKTALRAISLFLPLLLLSACSMQSRQLQAVSENDKAQVLEAGKDAAVQAELAQDRGKTGQEKSASGKSEILEMLETIALQADQTVVDGWFFGRDSRLLKSYYRKVPSLTKAEFAAAYHDFISGFDQNMVKDFKSYVPYSKRSDFAWKWWTENFPPFKSEILKMKVLFVHEAVQDAGELYWRAKEKLAPGSIDSMQALAHDEEQRMVNQFMEAEGRPGRISEQIHMRAQAQSH